VGAVVGAILLGVGLLMPWRSGEDAPHDLLGASALASSDGVLLLGIAVLAVIAAFARPIADSRTRTVQVVPVALGLVAVATWWVVLQRFHVLVDAAGGVRLSNTVQPGAAVSGIGVAVLVSSCASMSLMAWRSNGVYQDVPDARVGRQTVIASVVEVIMGALGMGFGAAVAFSVLGPFGFAAMIVAAVLGGSIGLAIGHRLGSVAA
jgi:hypothetical protein